MCTAGGFVRGTNVEIENIEMIKIDNSDMIDSFVVGLNRTGKWRQVMAVKYPLDPRNARAADLLLKLAAEASELSDEAFAKLKPHYSWASPRWREAISETARNAGFQRKITNLQSFVDCLLDVLSEQKVSA